MAVSDPERRTLPATPRHLKRLREQGILPHSMLLGPALAIAALPLVILGLSASLPSMLAYMKTALSMPAVIDLPHGVGSLALWLAVAPTVVIAGLVVLGGMTIRSPFRGQALSPLANLRRLFSRQSLSQGGVIAVGVVVLGAVWWVAWSRVSPGLTLAPPAFPAANGGRMESALGTLVIALGGAGAVLAVLAYGLARRAHLKRSNMTPEEFREDLKAGEGDPAVRAAWMRIRQSFYMERLKSQMERADVVVVNPTHYAVALAYEPWRRAAPEVVAAGKNEMARRIRRLAAEMEVPVLAAPSLARDLYQHVKVGEEIPGRLYQAVADLLAYLMRTYGYRPRTEQTEEQVP